DLGTPRLLEPLLRDAGLPVELAAGLDDAAVDDEVRTETEEALILTGRDVGTPILHFHPPGGTAFFGTVISRLPRPAAAGPLWDHVIALAAFPGFAEIKRSLRERPQLASFGVDTESVGIQEDWHGGSRRLKKWFARALPRIDLWYGRHIPQLPTARARDEVLRPRAHLGIPAHRRYRRRPGAVVCRIAGYGQTA